MRITDVINEIPK